MIYAQRCNFIRISTGKSKAASLGLTDEVRGLVGFALGDVRRTMCMTNVRVC